MPTSIVTRALRHGTTRQRANAIMRAGPDPSFREPGGADPAGGFSTCLVGGPNTVGTPEQYAAGKNRLFPGEGGPAIIEIEVPVDIVDLAIDAGGEVRFEPGFGLEQLQSGWSQISKRII